MRDSTDLTLFNLHLSLNRARGFGGALRFESDEGASLLLANSLVSDNFAVLSGGGISTDGRPGGREIINCTIAFNQTSSGVGNSGAGIHVDQHTDFVRVLNTILWKNPELANDDNLWTANPSFLQFGHSSIQNPLPGMDLMDGHNLLGPTVSADPIFVNEVTRNLRLQLLSPCRESGHDMHIPIDVLDVDEDTDFGEVLDVDIVVWYLNNKSAREQLTANPTTLFGHDLIPLNRIVDMGAYEQHGPAEGGETGI